jgi:hypothetical protein
MNRFISEMPSSMCCPFGPGSQRNWFRGRAGTVREESGRGGVAKLGLGGGGWEACPLVVGRNAQLHAQCVDLLGSEQRRVIERIAGERQAPALHGVGEQDGGSAGLGIGGLIGSQ